MTPDRGITHRHPLSRLRPKARLPAGNPCGTRPSAGSGQAFNLPANTARIDTLPAWISVGPGGRLGMLVGYRGER
ncbi:TPA: hypothetical protein I8Y12_001527 [Raoultella planticola]|nr:hypothetical protein [Raoultella planticola]